MIPLKKDKIMRHSLLILVAATSLTACGTVAQKTDVTRGLEPVNVPVVTRQDFAFDAPAPDGYLPNEQRARLDGWFQGLDLNYGDSVYVEGPSAALARSDVARLAGRYGMLVSEGGPVLAGDVPPGTVRVVVSRARASVPNCPDWSDAGKPTNYNNRTASNFGCGVNANLAMQIANPQDLIHGREGPASSDGVTGAKAVLLYRDWPLTAIVDGQQKRPLVKAETKGN